jgi:hypothetical protein
MKGAFVKDTQIVERQLKRDKEALQKKIAVKDNIIAEVTEAYVREKKRHGGV